MGPDLTDLPSLTACRVCRAALRPGAPWCTLCFTDLQPQPVPKIAVPLPADLVTQGPDGSPIVAAWPCTGCGQRNDFELSLCSGCGQPFLSGLTIGSRPLLVLPLVGDLAAMGRGRRLGLALALVVAVVVPLALIMLLLTPSKTKNAPVVGPSGPSSTQPATTGGSAGSGGSGSSTGVVLN